MRRPSVERSRMIARLSAKAGEHVTISDGPSLEARASRLGPRFDTGLTLSQFEVVLCVRVESPEHINVEKAKGLLCYVRWLLRSGSRFGHRVVVLSDSRFVIGAVSKGRSSPTRLNRVIRQLAALCFAGGLLLHLVFIPTEHNPADHPSRGGPDMWPAELRSKRKTVAQPAQTPMTRSDRNLADIALRIDKLKDAGYSDVDTDSSDASC